MIYKNHNGELWCECGNTIVRSGFFPVDQYGRYVEDITGDEKIYRCDLCGAITDIDRATCKEVGE